MSLSTRPSKFVPTTVSQEKLGTLVSKWRPYCLILAFYFKALRFVVAPIAGLCIIGLAISEILIPWYVLLLAMFTALGPELLRIWVLRKIPFYWAPKAK